MEVEYIDAKNGEKTIKVNSLFLHSSYSPSKEAERFVSSLSIPFEPAFIVIIEPGLSYCLPFLKQRYPNCKIGYISLCKDLPKQNVFDFEIDYLNNKENFSNYLNSFFNEQDLFKTYFVTWPGSIKIFEENNNLVWNGIKSATEQAKTLLITREYFEKKWLLNSCNLIKHIQNTVSLKSNINKDILICASGPSLQNNLNTIKDKQNSFFIIALSSALSVLLNSNIKPDLVFTTDGGYWAGEHLKKLKNIPLAIPLEAFCSKKIIKSNKILPLIYSDGLSYELKNTTSIKYYDCERNGTVSGSALDFALKHSNKNIYFFGLDLASQTGYQHTQPNELEINNCLKDFRIKTKEKRIYPGSLKNTSLQIYENWFKNKDFTSNRIFRVIDSEYKKNSLGKISDISSSDFELVCKKIDTFTEKYSFTDNEPRITELIVSECKQTYKVLSNKLQSENTLKQVFPLSFVLLSHLQKDSVEYNLQKEKIQKEKLKLLSKLGRILDE